MRELEKIQQKQEIKVWYIVSMARFDNFLNPNPERFLGKVSAVADMPDRTQNNDLQLRNVRIYLLGA